MEDNESFENERFARWVRLMLIGRIAVVYEKYSFAKEHFERALELLEDGLDAFRGLNLLLLARTNKQLKCDYESQLREALVIHEVTRTSRSYPNNSLFH